jgi:hypothetical protein
MAGRTFEGGQTCSVPPSPPVVTSTGCHDVTAGGGATTPPRTGRYVRAIVLNATVNRQIAASPRRSTDSEIFVPCCIATI